jgi:predicted transcriptional regulator
LEWSIVALKEEKTMLGVKQEVIKMIQSLPDEVTIDDIMAELYFKLQVDAGLKELDEGKGIPHQVVEKRMSKWLLR